MQIQNGVISTLSVLAVPDPRQQALWHYDYVQFGQDNLYPQHCASMFTISPTHEAVLESKRNFLNGNLKIDITGTGGNTIDLEDVDGFGTTMEELVDNIDGDVAMYESFYLEVIYNKTHTRIVQLNHIPYENVRVGKYNEDNRVDTVYVSPDWSRKYIKKNQPSPMAVFNPENIDTESQIIIARVKRPNQPYYTVPSYMSAVQYILLEDDIAELNRNDVTNGFFPSMIMNFFNGEPTETDKSDMEAYVNSKFKGATGSKLMMYFGNDPAKKVQLDTFTPPNLGEYSEKMIPLVENKILSAHRAFAGLVGISTGTGFSNKADELEAAFQLYLKNSIVPLQKLFINALKKVYKFNGVDSEIMFENELINTDKDEEVANAEVNSEKEITKSTSEPKEVTKEEKEANDEK